MKSTIINPGRRRLALEMLSLAAIGLLALRLAMAFPADRGEAVSWRDHRTYAVYFQSHQLFRRDPEELSESQLNALLRWCRCLELATRHQASGVGSLTDEECRFVVDVLDEVDQLCPDTEQLTAFGLIYESCAQSLARRRSAIASRHELHSPDRSVLLE